METFQIFLEVKSFMEYSLKKFRSRAYFLVTFVCFNWPDLFPENTGLEPVICLVLSMVMAQFLYHIYMLLEFYAFIV